MISFMTPLFKTPLFGILISLLAFEIGFYIFKKTKIPIFNPLLIAILLIILVLKFCNISLENYNIGGKFISFFLGPSTVILAVPLYKKMKLLKKYLVEIFLGIIIGSCSGMFSILILGKLLHMDKILVASLIPKSITTPIGIELCKQLGGNSSLTVASIIITGILGSIIGPLVCNIFKIKNEIAIGLSLGTSSHAVGTTKAMELGEIQGAMSGLAIGIAGIVTVLLGPLIFKLF